MSLDVTYDGCDVLPSESKLFIYIVVIESIKAIASILTIRFLLKYSVSSQYSPLSVALQYGCTTLSAFIGLRTVISAL